jgi:hypothetical protein
MLPRRRPVLRDWEGGRRAVANDLSATAQSDASGWSQGVVLFKGPTELVEELLIEFRLRRGVVILIARAVRSGQGRSFRVAEERRR